MSAQTLVTCRHRHLVEPTFYQDRVGNDTLEECMVSGLQCICKSTAINLWKVGTNDAINFGATQSKSVNSVNFVTVCQKLVNFRNSVNCKKTQKSWYNSVKVSRML
jgi:hypothetical protein